MRTIKFRGRKADNSGECVFGDLVQLKTKLLPANHYFILHNGHQDEVEPDSVAQLVGYDANGKEIYEGDTVIEEYVQGEKREAVAFLASVTRNPEGTDFFPFPAPFTTLKED